MIQSLGDVLNSTLTPPTSEVTDSNLNSSTLESVKTSKSSQGKRKRAPENSGSTDNVKEKARQVLENALTQQSLTIL